VATNSYVLPDAATDSASPIQTAVMGVPTAIEVQLMDSNGCYSDYPETDVTLGGRMEVHVSGPHGYVVQPADIAHVGNGRYQVALLFQAFGSHRITVKLDGEAIGGDYVGSDVGTFYGDWCVVPHPHPNPNPPTSRRSPGREKPRHSSTQCHLRLCGCACSL